MGKVIFITGVSSGFGKDMMIEASSHGHIVIGSVRNQDLIYDIEQIRPGFTFAVIMDVNDHLKVNGIVNELYNRFNKIDVVINNAGYGLMGAVEETTMQEAREQMDTNFFGALAVTQSILPIFRKQGSGHLIQFSSIAGLAGSPGLGLYNASKHALEGMSEALYFELLPLGIKVTIVEPGPFRTNWAGKSMKFASHQIEEYKETAGKLRDTITSYSGNQPGDPVKGAKAVMHIINTSKPPLRLLLGKVAIERAKGKLKWIQDDLEEWESIGLATDF